MDDRVGGLVGIGRRFAARTCHLPILGDLNKVFPHATDLEIQMLTSLRFGVDYSFYAAGRPFVCNRE